jgi:heme/copper-type cytochrome/quinol oxidase subunit 3
MILGSWELVLILAVILILSGARTLPEVSPHAVNRRNDPREIVLSCVTAFLAILALILVLQFLSK